MKLRTHKLLAKMMMASSLGLISSSASAYELYKTDSDTLNFDLEVGAGIYKSQESYGNSHKNPTWQEGYIKYGFSGEHSLASDYKLFAKANLLSSATWGDGDASGLTTGDESDTKFEDLYVGVRNDLFELSVGSQNFSVGDGFIINGDAVNGGKGLYDPSTGFSANRGGAYWIAARKAFNQAVIVKMGGKTGLRSDVFWFKSDNPMQASVEMAGINVEYTKDIGTFGFMYLKGLDVDTTEANFLGYQGRNGQTTTSVRYQGNAGIENLFLSGEYVDQENGVTDKKANAWYTEAGWTFASAPWSPSVHYRYTHYDEGYDPLFFGFSRGYGTWFQGEVAANYAGPFGTGTNINYIGITAQASDSVSLGLGYFNFSDKNGVDTAASNFDVGAQETDISLNWQANDHLYISPVIGFYTPDNSNNAQGNDDTNVYMQVIAVINY